ncbi:MAG: ribosome maturation factor RimM [Propionibacteriaceae bacterium]|nr:ribosome maturation factor RimM [Propionibacteriaceae bacterium]
MSDLIDVVVGRVVRAHGVRAEVIVESRTDEPERRFAVGSRVRLVPGRGGSGRTLTVASVRPHQGRLLVGFAELTTRTEAEGLAGALLEARVAADERPEDPQEFYDRQLVGLSVLRADGAVGGRIVEVQHPGVQDLLVVEVAPGERRLVPFVQALVPDVDLDAGTVTLADVAGLLEEA